MTVALVTGGFRRLGAAVARRLAEAGFDLALHAHEAGEPEPALAEALERHGTHWAAFHADLAESAEIDGLVDAAAKHFGAPPGVLVNSAARFEEDRWESVSMDCLVAQFKVNAAAPVLLAAALAKRLPEGGRGAVVNILDQRVANPPIDQLSYTLSKQALEGATRTLARALAPKVRVCGVAPGLTIATADYAPGQIDRLAAMMPLRRLPTPEGVAEAVLYLIGAEAVTGQVVYVDGGARLEAFERDFVYLGR